MVEKNEIGKKKNKEEDLKSWICLLIITSFVNKYEYLRLFNNDIINAIINICFGLILITLFYLFFKKEKEWLNPDNQFQLFLATILIFLGIFSSFYHIGYANLLIFFLFQI